MIRLIWRIALRNVLAHRVKSIIVGMIFALGALVGVVGNALVDAMDNGMARSIQESMAGHLQVHARDARDPLSIYGDEFASMPDFGVMPDFAAVAKVIRGVAGVKAVVPMGSQIAMSDGGNLLDRKLAALRGAVRAGDAAGVADLRAHVRRIVELVAHDLTQARVLGGDAETRARIDDAERADTDAFWAGFAADPLGSLEFLENRVAPLLTQAAALPIWFLGTDLHAFAERFPRFRIVEGTMVPPDTRGFLFNHSVYEKQVKHRAARALDALVKARGKGEVIAADPRLQLHVDVLANQASTLLRELGPADSVAVTVGLRAHLDAPEAALPELLDRFVAVDDETVTARRDLFYDLIAPRIELYAVRVGDVLTLRSFTRTGYARAANLRVYGTFTFEGLEDSTITAQHNLVDMVTFRELFGYASPEAKAEIAEMRDAAGVEDVTREDAEAALFGGGAALEAVAAPAQAVPSLPVAPTAAPSTFPPTALERGMALHAAVLLEDASPEAIAAAKTAVQQALDAAGLEIRVLTWQEASGIVGQIVLMIRIVLFVVVSLLSIVALVIINNSMVMATMDRVREIGTMRAIGAQRGFITQLFVTESLVLALVAGGVGALIGGGIVAWIGSSGLPATNEFTTFLYSGPALHPTLSVGHVVAAVINVALVGIVSTFYPAGVAAKIPPVEAMAARG